MNIANLLFCGIISTMEENKEAEVSEEKPVQEEKKPRKKHPLLWLKITIPLVSAAILLCAGYFAWKNLTRVTIEKKHSLIYSQIQKVAELTVLKYNYSDISSLKKGSKFGKYYSLVKYKAVIRVGIPDVSRIRLEISDDGKTVNVELPHTEILENALLTQEVFDDNLNTWQFFTQSITTQEIFDNIAQNMKRQQEENEKQLLRDSDAQLALLVKAMIQSAGFEPENISIHFITRLVNLLSSGSPDENGAFEPLPEQNMGPAEMPSDTSLLP